MLRYCREPRGGRRSEIERVGSRENRRSFRLRGANRKEPQGEGCGEGAVDPRGEP